MQQRRLEKEPSVVTPYLGAVGQGHNFILANRDLTLQVFSDFQLVWAVTVGGEGRRARDIWGIQLRRLFSFLIADSLFISY